MSKLHRTINETIEIGKNYSHLTVQDIQKHIENEIEVEKYLMCLTVRLNTLVDKKSSLMGLTENIQLELKEKSSSLNNFSEIQGSINEFDDFFELELSKYNEMQERFIIIYNKYEKNLKKIREKFVETCKDIKNIYFNSRMHFNLYSCCRDINEVENYTDEELSFLVKGIVIGEVYWMKGESGGAGSVTSTFAIAYALEFRNKELAEETKRWVEKFGYYNEMYGAYRWNGGEENYKKQIEVLEFK